KEELRLGAMLVRLRKVASDTMDRALNKPRSGRWRVGSVLLADKLLSETELASFLKVQVSEVIFDTFGWREGVFTFWEKVPPPATAVTLEMDLQNLLMEGSRRVRFRPPAARRASRLRPSPPACPSSSRRAARARPSSKGTTPRRSSPPRPCSTWPTASGWCRAGSSS